MKIKENEKKLALRGAEALNKIRNDVNGKGSFYVEWVAILREYKAPYYTHSVAKFIKYGILKESGIKTHSGRVCAYVLQDKPIHYSDLIPIYEEIRNRGREINLTGQISAEERAAKISLMSKKNREDIEDIKQEGIFKDCLDSDLIAELRKRGYEVTAEKVTVIKL